MPKYTIEFDLPVKRGLYVPPQELQKTANYEIEKTDSGVAISGNRDGLLLLGETLVRIALGGYYPEFHIHMGLTREENRGPNMDDRPELTIYGPTDGEPLETGTDGHATRLGTLR